MLLLSLFSYCICMPFKESGEKRNLFNKNPSRQRIFLCIQTCLFLSTFPSPGIFYSWTEYVLVRLLRSYMFPLIMDRYGISLNNCEKSLPLHSIWHACVSMSKMQLYILKQKIYATGSKAILAFFYLKFGITY